MSNRPRSLVLQMATVGILSCLWLIARGARKGQNTTDRLYSLNRKRHALLSLLMFAADVYAIPAILRGKGLISTEELAGGFRDLVPAHDRRALQHKAENRERIRKLSDNVLKTVVGMPLLLIADERLRKDAATLGVLYLWLHAVTYTLYSFSPLGPAFVDKYRPVVYYTGIPEQELLKGNNRNASYSGHTSSAACASFFMAKVYCDYHHRLTSLEKYLIYALAFLPPMLVGGLRVRALKHFPSDVLQAIVIGAACGVMIPELYRNK